MGVSWFFDYITWPKKLIKPFHTWYHIWYHAWYHTHLYDIISRSDIICDISYFRMWYHAWYWLAIWCHMWYHKWYIDIAPDAGMLLEWRNPMRLLQVILNLISPWTSMMLEIMQINFLILILLPDSWQSCWNKRWKPWNPGCCLEHEMYPRMHWRSRFRAFVRPFPTYGTSSCCNEDSARSNSSELLCNILKWYHTMISYIPVWCHTMIS